MPDHNLSLTPEKGEILNKSQEKDHKIEELELELSKKNKELEDLKKELCNCKGRLDEIRDEKKILMDDLNRFETMKIDLELVKAQKLQDENHRLAHRIQVTKDQLDHARDHIKLRDQIIAELSQMKTLDYVRKRYPESFRKYQTEEKLVFKNQFQK